MTNEFRFIVSKRALLSGLILIGCLLPVSQCRAQWHQTGLKEGTFFQLPFESSDLLACTRLGILRSSDAGITWTSVGYGLIYQNVQSAALRKISPSLYYLFAGTEGGVFRLPFPASSEWLLTSQWLPQDAITSLIVVDTLMFATTGRSGVYVTSDNGAHWLSRNTGLPAPNPFVPRTSSLTLLGGYLFIAAGPGLYRSSDMGEHWSLTNTGMTAQWVFCLTAVQNVLYAGTDNGVFRSSDYERLGPRLSASRDSTSRVSEQTGQSSLLDSPSLRSSF